MKNLILNIYLIFFLKSFCFMTGGCILNNKTKDTTIKNDSINCILLNEDFDVSEETLKPIRQLYHDFSVSKFEIDIIMIRFHNDISAMRFIHKGGEEMEIINNIKGVEKKYTKKSNGTLDKIQKLVQNAENGSFNFECGNSVIFGHIILYILKTNGQIRFKLRTTSTGLDNLNNESKIANAAELLKTINEIFKQN